MSWFEKEFGEDVPADEVSLMLREYVKRGIVEQSIDENGEFVFSLTELGEQIFSDLNRGNKDG